MSTAVAILNAIECTSWIFLAYICLNAWMDYVIGRQLDLSLVHWQTLFCTVASLVEVLQALLGWTKTKPLNAAVFVVGRGFIALYIARFAVNFHSLAFLLTATFWSIGESVRFFCFALSTVQPSLRINLMHIRYTVGPILFPLGFIGEMCMLVQIVLSDFNILVLVITMMWPFGFIPLLQSLLRQRKKFLTKKSE